MLKYATFSSGIDAIVLSPLSGSAREVGAPVLDLLSILPLNKHAVRYEYNLQFFPK
jgi:hypothetical protein